MHQGPSKHTGSGSTGVFLQWFLFLKPDFHTDFCIIYILNPILIIKGNAHDKNMMKMKIMPLKYGVSIKKLNQLEKT